MHPLSSLKACSEGCCLSAPSTRISQFNTADFIPWNEEWVFGSQNLYLAWLDPQVWSPTRPQVVTKRSLCGHALQTLGAYLCVNNLCFYISAGIQHFMSCILSPVNCFLFSISKDFASPHIIVSFPHEQSFYCTFYWTKIGLWCYVCLCVHGGEGFLEGGDLLQTLFH